METHSVDNVGSGLSDNRMDSTIPMNMVLVKEHTKHELIILTYRIAVIATGIVLVVLGYLLFSNSATDFQDSQSYYQELNRLALGTVFAIVGILFCISGVTKLMPLPKFDRMDGINKVQAQDKSNVETPLGVSKDVETEVPTLSPMASSISYPGLAGKLWKNNVRPIMEKVANNEKISHSDRELLKNWLRSL